MTVLSQIAANDPSLKEICLSEPAEEYFSDVSEMVDALKNNTNIVSVRIDREFLQSLLGQPEKKAAVVMAIGGLPNLRELCILAGPVHAVVLGEALQLPGGANLETLQLGRIDFKGSQEDFKALEVALHGHKNLQKFSYSHAKIQDESVSLEDLVRALATIPTLHDLALEQSTNEAHFSGEALASLFESSNFTNIRISGYRLYVQHYQIISDAIKNANSLKSLALLKVGMANPCSKKLSEGLANNRSLEVLELSGNNIEDEGCIALAEALKTNQTLKHLCLFNNRKIGVAGFDAIADMLQVNTTLTRVDVPLGVCPEKKAIIAEMMQSRAVRV